jgi:serine/threonine protein kinase
LKLELVRVLVNNGDRITWQARAEALGGMLVAVKCFKDPADRDLETYFYDKLAPMQGISIPRLLVKECTLPRQRKQRCHAFIVEWVGPEFGGNFLTLPTKALVAARLVAERMHALGVVHGDARPENMFFNFTSGELFMYDFSHARAADVVGREEFEGACEEELESLDEQIAWSQTEQAAKIRYVRWDEPAGSAQPTPS